MEHKWRAFADYAVVTNPFVQRMRHTPIPFQVGAEPETGSAANFVSCPRISQPEFELYLGRSW